MPCSDPLDHTHHRTPADPGQQTNATPTNADGDESTDLVPTSAEAGDTMPARGLAAFLASNDAGQTTVEYALVILAAGTLALAAILWARDSGSITDLFENVVERLTGDL